MGLRDNISHHDFSMKPQQFGRYLIHRHNHFTALLDFVRDYPGYLTPQNIIIKFVKISPALVHTPKLSLAAMRSIQTGEFSDGNVICCQTLHWQMCSLWSMMVTFLYISQLFRERVPNFLHLKKATTKWKNRLQVYDFKVNRKHTTLHPFNGLFSRTTWVSQHQKGKPFWILMKQEMMGVAVASAGPYADH